MRTNCLIVRAREPPGGHAYARISPRMIQVQDENTRLFNRLYRFALCDSLPPS